MQGYLSLIEDWTKANSKDVITAIIGVLITPVLEAVMNFSSEAIASWHGEQKTVPKRCF